MDNSWVGHRAATDLPELSTPTKRKLEIQWNIMLDAHGLTGEHLRWREREVARRRRIEMQMPHRRVSHSSDDSGPDQMAAGRKGIARTVAVAEGRFTNLSEEYWRLWSGAGYEIFASWLDVLKRKVADEVASIWKGHSDPIDQWYESWCVPAVEKALGALISEWVRRSREAELERMKGEERLEPSTTVNGKSSKLGAQESALTSNEPAQSISQPQAAIRAATASGTDTEASTESLLSNVPAASRNGALTDTDFWLRAEVKFRTLQPKPPPARRTRPRKS
jgi:hypothetical protein